MQTVQLQCGSCQNMMAISVEHLGAQVQCPHCAAVVQTPPRSALGGPPPGPDPTPPTYQPPISYEPPPPPPPPSYQPPPYQPPAYQQPAYQQPAYQQPSYQPPMMQAPPEIKVPERESIFSEPEPRDDLFGEEDAPKIQMPEPRVSVAEPEREPVREQIETVEPVDDDDEQSVPTGLSEARTRLAAERKRGSIAPMMLVFLIPYAIFTTAFIAYLLVMWPSITQFEWLTDPTVVPKHDLPLQKKSKVGLNQPIKVGGMEITPISVAVVGNGLTLEFKAHNVSANQTICPIEENGFFFKAVKGTARPFTFLEQLTKEKEKDVDHRIYGGELVYVNKGKEQADCVNLRPGEECVIKLSTLETAEVGRRVNDMLNHQGRFQWRLQFRRGTEPFKGGQLPMTAVVGIEFDRKDIKGG